MERGGNWEFLKKEGAGNSGIPVSRKQSNFPDGCEMLAQAIEAGRFLARKRPASSCCDGVYFMVFRVLLGFSFARCSAVL